MKQLCFDLCVSVCLCPLKISPIMEPHMGGTWYCPQPLKGDFAPHADKQILELQRCRHRNLLHVMSLCASLPHYGEYDNDSDAGSHECIRPCDTYLCV